MTYQEALHQVWMGTLVYSHYERAFRIKHFQDLLGRGLIQIDLIKDKVMLTDKGSAELLAYYFTLGLGSRGSGHVAGVGKKAE